MMEHRHPLTQRAIFKPKLGKISTKKVNSAAASVPRYTPSPHSVLSLEPQRRDKSPQVKKLSEKPI